MGPQPHGTTVTTVVAAVATVHESAAVCDHLADREDVETVVGVGVAPGGAPTARRDAGEALDVLAVRLPDREVATERREGDPATVVPMVADEYGADEVLVAEGFAEREAVEAACERPVTAVADPSG